MGDHPGLICTFDIGLRGKAKPLEWEDLEDRQPKNLWRWIHLDRNQPDTENWLQERADLPDLAIEALLAEETRPRIISLVQDTSSFCAA